MVQIVNQRTSVLPLLGQIPEGDHPIQEVVLEWMYVHGVVFTAEEKVLIEVVFWNVKFSDEVPVSAAAVVLDIDQQLLCPLSRTIETKLVQQKRSTFQFLANKWN